MKLFNRVVYERHKEEGFKCPYAKTILEKKDGTGKVECNYGDTAQGVGNVAFDSSPLYVSNFSGHGMDGIYSYPLGFYADNNESKSILFFV